MSKPKKKQKKESYVKLDNNGKPHVYIKNAGTYNEILKPVKKEETMSNDSKWNDETKKGTYSDKVHHGEMKQGWDKSPISGQLTELPKEIQDLLDKQAKTHVRKTFPYYKGDDLDGSTYDTYREAANAWAKIAIGFAEWKDAKGYRRERGRKNKERIYGEWYIPAAGYGGGQPITYTSEQLLLEYLKTLPPMNIENTDSIEDFTEEEIQFLSLYSPDELRDIIDYWEEVIEPKLNKTQ